MLLVEAVVEKNVYFRKNRMMVRSNNAWKGDGKVLSGVGMSADKIKDVTKLVSRNNNVLCEIDARKVLELNSLWIKKIINMYVEVLGDEEFMWDDSGIGKESGKLISNGWEWLRIGWWRRRSVHIELSKEVF